MVPGLAHFCRIVCPTFSEIIFGEHTSEVTKDMGCDDATRSFCFTLLVCVEVTFLAFSFLEF
jgi:hypothetical protein